MTEVSKRQLECAARKVLDAYDNRPERRGQPPKMVKAAKDYLKHNKGR